MYRVLRASVVLILLLSMAQATSACSSFAVYGKKGPIFGMNWDFTAYGEMEGSPVGYFEDIDARITISHSAGTKIFGLVSLGHFHNPLLLFPRSKLFMLHSMVISPAFGR